MRWLVLLQDNHCRLLVCLVVLLRPSHFDGHNLVLVGDNVALVYPWAVHIR